MTVKELIKLLQSAPPDALVVSPVNFDEWVFSPLETIESNMFYVANSDTEGEAVGIDDIMSADVEHFKNGIPAVCLWPVSR